MYKVRLLLIALCALLTAFTLRELHRLIEYGKPLNLLAVSGNGHVSAYERSLRPIWPYSVIPGGAYNVDELKYFMTKDKVIRAHYADFEIDNTRVVTLAEDRYQYVSYRVNNVVYWTRKKLRIPKGEVLLTDGKHFARTRCGNRLCAALAYSTTFVVPPIPIPVFPNIDLLPKYNLAFAPPPEIDFGPIDQGPAPYIPAPVPYPPPATEWPAVQAAPVFTPVIPAFAAFPAVVASPTLPGASSESPVPEPASVYMFLSGFALCLWLAARCFKQPRLTKDGS
ncbi:MAG TPA: hypothetical protein VH302_02275 [Bryobacteraceae bacterium]|jgi:hypothetical protein|nr:hypothetical protein [Bryobacteraceae bacterium]